MNLLPSSDQRQIIDTLRSFLANQSPMARFRPPSSQIGNDDAALWPKLGELGFLGIGIDEQSGGIGLGAVEEMLAYREFGRHLLSPAILAVTLAAQLAAACGASDELRTLISGNAAVGLANPRGPVHIGAQSHGEFHLFDADTDADTDAGTDADTTPWILCSTEQATALFTREQFIHAEPVLGIDNVVHLQRAGLQNAKPLLWVDGTSSTNSTNSNLYLHSLLLIAAYAVGMAEATRDMAVDYAKLREQFGRPIGAFQAVKHICADMAIRAEAALCQTSFAALVAHEGKSGIDFHITSAKMVATKAALDNAAQNIQVHGAVGFTAEASAHLFLKRAHVMDQLGGDLRRQRERLLDLSYPEAA